jgi:hypothetical protein
MNGSEGLREQVINNSYDYSNALVDEQSLLMLCECVDDAYKNMYRIFENDEKKNERLKWEYKNYEYKKGYNNLEYVMRYKDSNSFNCESYEALISHAKEGRLRNLTYFAIKMDLNYSRGNSNLLTHINNSFVIAFGPYDILFTRRANYNEVYMNQIEEGINSILKQFKKYNTIFCWKE